jgi:hydrogenase/urease accessory protein HupE
MLKRIIVTLLCWCCYFVPPAQAHDIPRTQIELQVAKTQIGTQIDATITFSLLGFSLDYPAVTLGQNERDKIASLHQGEMARAVSERFTIHGATGSAPDTITYLPDRNAIRFEQRFTVTQKQEIEIETGNLFPVDPNHVVFLSIYDQKTRHLLREVLLNHNNSNLTYTVGSAQSSETILAVIGQFIREGVHHIFIGPDHILFIIGLLLLGGNLQRLLKIITAFTLAHSITLVLATLNILNPSPRLIEPTIALSIVVVGIHSLVTTAKPTEKYHNDLRLPLAFCFGLIHGFGFASVLQELALPREALGWSLLSFNVGVEIGQACVVLTVAPLLAYIAQKSERAGKVVITIGGWIVVLAGAYWFGERLLP